MWWPEVELNHRHTDFQSVALPTELSGLFLQVSMNVSTGVFCEFLKQGWCRRGEKNSQTYTGQIHQTFVENTHNTLFIDLPSS